MAPRSSWKGYLKLSLVSLPVKAYTATTTTSAIRLNQLHAECHSRIKYQKVCPVHGEVTGDEIVSGYEFAKGQYVIVDPDELQQLRSEGDKAINVNAFIRSDALDPVYQSGRTYYLVPDGPVGQRPYALVRQAMVDEGLHAVAQVVLSNREQLVLLRPIEHLIGMTVLEYKNQVKDPASFEDEISDGEASQQEIELTRQLMQGMLQEEFDLGQYRDVYTEKLTELIQAKVEGKELVAPPATEEPQVINLMEALKQSVQQVKPPKREAASQKKKPAKKTAPSAPKGAKAKKKTAKRKRKTS
jgi:DNA end-binding protein Ku